MSLFYKYDIDRAREVVKVLHSYFRDAQTVKKATIELPNDIEYGSKEHYLYIFYGCLLDYGVKSYYYHQRLKRAYSEFRELFSPDYILENFKNDIEILSKVLSRYLKVRFPIEAAKRWYSLSEVLCLKYKCDPRNLIKKATTLNELRNLIIEIRGFGQKTGGLLIRILHENGLLNNINESYIPFIPIDRHDIKISMRLGVIRNIKENFSSGRVSNRLPTELSKIWVKASILEGVDPAETDRNLWLLGSRLCASNKCYLCPVEGLCNQNSSKGDANEAD